MERARLDQLTELGGWRVGESVEVTGADPVLPSPWPVGEIAAVARAQAGAAAGVLARRAGGDPGPARVEVADAAAATIGFALDVGWVHPTTPLGAGSLTW